MKQTDPLLAQRMLHKYYGKRATLHRSTRADKKYMVEAPNGTWVHFGQKGYADYTGHRDKERRDRFRTRNAQWATADKWTPAHLAYYVLW